MGPLSHGRTGGSRTVAAAPVVGGTRWAWISVVSWGTTGQLGVGVQLQFAGGEVVSALACGKEACRFCPIMTEVDRKIASRETIRVKVG